ncbi:MAG: DUF2339 domain-containing protein [Cyclobacteriaceae bacterium]|nr:DUF2339 domain-containing protein [Cyclobacteriaceae bacterium]MDH5250023.1 DUF2339 domain-containing protein [Cyclobacteriaceae bacterium]
MMLESLLFVLTLIILVMVAGIRNSLSKLGSLEKRIDLLIIELQKIHAKVSKPEPSAKINTITDTRPDEATPSPVATPKEELKPVVLEEKKMEENQEVVSHAVAFPNLAPQKIIVPAPPKPKQPGFFARNPDLEKFIGENLANKIGIGVLVLGIGFFVKYAIDQNWINEIGRVFIGILCGGILLGVAHKLRKIVPPFSSVLVGGGIAVLYLTIAIAYHEYQLFTQSAAFVMMVVITGVAVLFSVAYNRVELAVVSLLGGFASPFMVSTGEGNFVVLFTYVLILDVGMLALAYFKRWNLVNIIAYVFTVILFGSWLGVKYDYEAPGMMAGAFTFASLFYVVFFAMNLINNIKSRTPFNSMEISLILSNTFLYYGVGMFILNNPVMKNYQGLFTAALGVVNFLIAYPLYRKDRVDKKIVFLLIGLVLTFISLAAPVQLEGNHITLFWAAEAVLLLWLSQKSGIRLMKLTSGVVMVLMLLSLLIDWTQIYGPTQDAHLMMFLNKGYITGLVATISIGLTLFFVNRETDEFAQYIAPYKIFLAISGALVLYITHLLELRQQLFQYEVVIEAQNIIIGCYNIFFLLVILYAGRTRTAINEKMFLAFAGTIGLMSFLFFYHNQIVEARNFYLLEDGSITGFIFHYPLLLLLVGVAYLSLKVIQGLAAFNEETHYAYSWFYVFFFLFMASAELDHTVLLLASGNNGNIWTILTQNHKIGYPMLWGLTSFLLIFVGLKYKKKQLRIISLTLFLITLIKLFVFDIRGISEGGKIAAFISLGILLLVVSFMYQRLKKLLLADGEGSKTSEKTA